MNTKYLLWEPPSSSPTVQPMKLRVYMCFSDNNNQDFIKFFNAIGRKLDIYNQLTGDDYMNTNIPYRLQNWPNRGNLLLLSNLLKKYIRDTRNDFCGDFMNPFYLEDSANDKKMMCIFITGTNPHNNSEERLHSAATVYFSNKIIPSESSNSSSASSNSMTFTQEKVLNVEAICAADSNYVTHNGGKKLMAFLVGACREMPIKHIYLYSIDVQRTLDFYNRLGFVKTGEIDDGNLEHKLSIGTGNDTNVKSLVSAVKIATARVNKKQKTEPEEPKVKLELITAANYEVNTIFPDKSIKLEEGWTENDERDLNAYSGVFASLQHELEVATAEVGSKRKRGGGSNKRKRKSKKRKSKAQNSKTRARVS